MPLAHRPLKNSYERFTPRHHDLPNDAPHQAVLEASTLMSGASPLEKIAIGAAALGLAVSPSIFGVPAEAPQLPTHTTQQL